jgi:integrase-like protein
LSIRLPAPDGRKAGEPVQNVKSAFHTALETAEIKGFTWHDLRHTFGSWLIIKGASLRSVAELLVTAGFGWSCGTRTYRPNICRLKVGLLDSTPAPPPAPTGTARSERAKRATGKAQRNSKRIY